MIVLPHSPDAEKGALCSFFLSPKTVGALFVEQGITSRHFHLPAHDAIFRHLDRMWREDLSIDLITVSQAVHDAGDVSTVGGHAYVTEVATFLPTAANVHSYLDILEQKRVLREIAKTTHEFQTIIQNDESDPESTLAALVDRVGGIATAKVAQTALTPKQIVMAAQERAEVRLEKRGMRDDVILTGIQSIDEAMSGMPEGSYVLVSGKEKSGKSSFAVNNIFLDTIFEQKKRAMLISLEMKEPEITDRCLSALGRINLTAILNGWMTEGDMMKFPKVGLSLVDKKFSIRDDLFSLTQIISAIRQEKAKHPDLALVVIDYLQLIDLEKASKETLREQVIAQISRTIRRLANELKIVIVMLVQLNEDGQVRESRSVGMDCTAHLRIENSKEEGMKWLRVVYQRNGPSNVGIPLTHLGQFVMFEQFSGEAGDIPDLNSSKKKR